MVGRCDDLQFELHGPAESESRPLAVFNTDVQIRVGQKAVIGKSTPEGAEAMILIVEAALVE